MNSSDNVVTALDVFMTNIYNLSHIFRFDASLVTKVAKFSKAVYCVYSYGNGM